jgi:hypothetical protein
LTILGKIYFLQIHNIELGRENQRSLKLNKLGGDLGALSAEDVSGPLQVDLGVLVAPELGRQPTEKSGPYREIGINFLGIFTFLKYPKLQFI